MSENESDPQTIALNTNNKVGGSYMEEMAVTRYVHLAAILINCFILSSANALLTWMNPMWETEILLLLILIRV